ncbi:hypothetical protein D3C78_1398090 [compost metagenome]
MEKPKMTVANAKIEATVADAIPMLAHLRLTKAMTVIPAARCGLIIINPSGRPAPARCLMKANRKTPISVPVNNPFCPVRIFRAMAGSTAKIAQTKYLGEIALIVRM